MEIETKLRKWGNSFGIVVPMEIIQQGKLEEGEDIIIEVKKKNKLKEIFGSLKDSKINSQRIKEELRKDWSKW